MLKKQWKALPLERLVIYGILFTLLPLFLFLPLRFKTKQNEITLLKEQLEKVATNALLYEQKQAINTAVRRHFASSQATFLSERLEKKEFLTKEKTALEKLIHASTFAGNDVLEKRYRFLSSANKIALLEGSIARKEGVTETLLSFSHPVEMDTSDLKQLLQTIEEKEVGAPQLVIADFRLTKKQMSQTGEVYELTAQLLKREFSP